MISRTKTRACASISITGFGNQYGLSDLTRVSAVIVDENDTSAYLEDAVVLAVQSLLGGLQALLGVPHVAARPVETTLGSVDMVRTAPSIGKCFLS